MKEDDRKILTDSIGGLLDLKEKYSDYEINSNFDLLLSQLDLFKTISTLIIAIIGIGYFLNENSDPKFSILALFFSLVTVIGTISYTREMIDLKSSEITEEGKKFRIRIDQGVQVAVTALKTNDSKVFFDYAKVEADSKDRNDTLAYSGEIFTFFFYLAITFSLLSFFSHIHFIDIFSYHTVIGISISYFLSYKDWSNKFIKILSTQINFK